MNDNIIAELGWLFARLSQLNCRLLAPVRNVSKPNQGKWAQGHSGVYL